MKKIFPEIFFNIFHQGFFQSIPGSSKLSLVNQEAQSSIEFWN